MRISDWSSDVCSSDLWKRAVGATSNDLGDAVGQLYVKHYFPASSQAEIEQLVKNLIAAFTDRIDTLSWLTPATREKAKAKLATLRVGVGYPDTWSNYSSEERRGGQEWVRTCRTRRTQNNIKKNQHK